ncbi:5-formyltetrahydrofolate cyclo-ligase [Stanieria cyanosphaera PCC 7437]|uniref:5-formyltetrahydrofolate cyclo-ligase n=1 Tax=Stanieria cyanosphaera (strain ATCC 29371 / PCC 7437) TaxID=111780 RepID=K9XT09_STAC7|nr:5-formyltetrahydrofolate cyclo-ligase [Stanieria cyanosphaera]AFZ35740.1 5-formyltetrahydrofolate cyclo-ligase [Stanieria cyanosphaera PCC 7437]
MQQQITKKQLRKKILEQRKSLTKSEWQTKSDRICKQLQSSSLFNQAETVLAYFSIHQEPDLSPLFTINKKWGFPRCVNQLLVWHSWQLGEQLQQGLYNIQEPLINAPLIQPQAVDLILVPTVACDAQKYRLGYGGGFYDRMLSDQQWQNKTTIGIVFDFAYLPQLPIDPWDIKLDYICTETGLY